MKKSELLQLKKEGNALDKKVINSLLDQGTMGEIESYAKDVLQYGCQSGMVGELIYYTDTVKFYNKYQKEIDVLLRETMEETGIYSPKELFGNKWDDEDPLAREEINQNLLAWFGYEETVRRILNALEIEY